MRWLGRVIQFVGNVGVFGFRGLIDAVQPPFEHSQVLRQLAEVGNKSIVLIVASGFSLEAVMTLHTRNTLVTFGAAAMIPAVQAVSFFVEEERCEAPQSLTHVEFNTLSLACTLLPNLCDQDRLGRERDCADSTIWQSIGLDGVGAAIGEPTTGIGSCCPQALQQGLNICRYVYRVAL